MSEDDPRKQAITALTHLRESATCGTCRKDYDVMIDALERDGEFEGIMREYVAISRRHQDAGALLERTAGITGARNEAERLLQKLKGKREPAPGFLRSMRNDVASVVPRPLGLLSPNRRRRT